MSTPTKHQNGRIPRSSNLKMVTLIKKDPRKEDIVSNSAKHGFKILAVVLAKMLARVVWRLQRGADLNLPGRIIRDNFHLLRYFIGRIRKFSGESGALTKLYLIGSTIGTWRRYSGRPGWVRLSTVVQRYRLSSE